MSRIPLPLVTPDQQRFSCVGCGRCCRGRFAVHIPADERRRIVAQGWEERPEYAGVELFVSAGRDYVLGHRPDGSCVFLDDDGLCRIHKELGEPAKPLACRLYPFVLLPAGDRVLVDLRFDCPTVAANGGRPVAQHERDLRQLLPLVVPETAGAIEPPPLYGREVLTWADLREVAARFERILGDVSLDLTRRVLAAVNLASFLRTMRAEVLAGESGGELLDALATSAVEGALRNELRRRRPGRGLRTLFRQMVGLYGKEDTRAGTAGWVDKLRSALGMVGGRGLVPELQAGFPQVPFEALETPLGPLPPDAAEPLARFYQVELASLSFCGLAFFQRDFLDGLEALLLTYPVALWFARAYALGREAPAVDREAVLQAVMTVAHQHGLNPVFNLPNERLRLDWLTTTATLRELVIWYG